MNMIFAIAWKNVWRSKRRSIVIITASTLGLWGGVFASGFNWGLSESYVESAIERDFGHIQVHPEGYISNPQIVNYIPSGGEILDTIAATQGVLHVSGRTLVECMVSSATTSTGLQLIGIDPEAEGKITSIRGSIVEGDYFETDAMNAVIIGKKLADRLKVGVGKKVVVSFQGLDSTITYGACRVVGIFRSGSSVFDEMKMFITHRDLWALLERENIYHQIVVKAETARQVDTVYAGIDKALPKMDVQTWRMLAPELTITVDSMEFSSLIFIAIILIALIFGLTNTMFMAILERIREVGVLLAIGMKKRKIFTMIVIETIVLSMLGGVFGLILGGVSILFAGQSGIDLASVSSGLELYGISSMVYPYLPLEIYFELFAMIVVAAVVAAIFPALRAIHTQPATAIRTY